MSSCTLAGGAGSGGGGAGFGAAAAGLGGGAGAGFGGAGAGVGAAFAAGSVGLGGVLAASSSAMIRRMEARISSIEGSCAFAACDIAVFSHRRALSLRNPTRLENYRTVSLHSNRVGERVSRLRANHIASASESAMKYGMSMSERKQDTGWCKRSWLKTNRLP
jgi:hypothetical protein